MLPRAGRGIMEAGAARAAKKRGDVALMIKIVAKMLVREEARATVDTMMEQQKQAPHDTVSGGQP